MFEEATARSVGTWNIVLGIVAISVGVAVGVGCLVSGGRLLTKY